MKKLFFVFVVMLFFGFPVLHAETGHSELRRSSQQDSLAAETRRASHGMIVFGQQRIYFYHLPMWHSPHAWHLILEVELDSSGRALYRADQAAGGTLQSFSPQPFALANIKPGYEIRGVLYHGHFEQGGEALPKSSAPALVTATVIRVITVKALEPNAPLRSATVYRIFGVDGEWFAARLPSREPDFDQVLAITPTDLCRIPEDAALGLTVTLEGVNNSLEGRPQPGDTLSAKSSTDSQFCFKVEVESYFSTSDLGG
jgi:hypothetical protein